MAKTKSFPEGRISDLHEGDLVVFLIGMRVNNWLRSDKWWPVASAMPKMIRELQQLPEYGFLGAENLLIGFRTVALLQYWRDFEGLHRYAHDRKAAHLPAWKSFNKAARNSGAVGIFHETYVVPAGHHESIYVSMPAFGLGKISGVAAAAPSAAARLHRTRPAEGQ